MRKITTLLLTLMVGLSMALGTAAPASAAPYVTQSKLDYGYDATVRGGFIYFSEYVPPSTQLYLTVASCGRVLHTQTNNGVIEVASVTDGSTLYVQIFQKTISRSMAGPTIDISVSFSDPNLPPVSATAYTSNSYPRDCSGVGTGTGGTDNGDKLVIQKWSKKKPSMSKAKVGKKLAITATRAKGAQKTYVWFAGSKKLSEGRTPRVKRNMVGKTIEMKVTVFKGNQTKRKTLKFGRAHR